MPSADITLGLAFAAGLLSFVSPCVLPLAPVYLSYLTGVAVSDRSAASRTHVMAHAALFITGFSAVFVLLGVSAAFAFGSLVKNDFADWLIKAGGLVLVVLGLYMSGALAWLAARFERAPTLHSAIAGLDRGLGALILPERRLDAGGGMGPGLARSGVVGMSFAAGWTPCVGPLLGAVLTLAAGVGSGAGQGAGIAQASALLIAYSAGLGLPFLVTAAFLSGAARFLHTLNTHRRVIELTSAVLLVGIGMLALFGSVSSLNQYFSNTPDWLYTLEKQLMERN